MRKKNNSIIIALYFCVIIFSIVLIAVISNIIRLWNNAIFDGKHQFILGINGHNPVEAIIFRPDLNRIDAVNFNGENNAFNLYSTNGILFDAVINYDDRLNSKNFYPEGYFFSQIFSLQKNSLNVVDNFRLWLFVNTVRKDNINKYFYKVPISQSSYTSLPQIFTDTLLYQEGKTISVINASNIYGEGSAFASGLALIGANVISITTAINQENSSYISFSGIQNYTVLKLSRETHIPISYSRKNNNLADITIVLGKDIKSKLN